MPCTQFHLILSFVLKANNYATYLRAKQALLALLNEGRLCLPHRKLMEDILSSDEAFQPLFKKALEQFVAIHCVQLFFTNIANAMERGDAFIKIVEEQFPGIPSDPAVPTDLADRIWNAAEGNPEAMQLVAFYGITAAEIEEGKIW